MKLSMIAAMSKNRAIGVKNGLPWSIPEDMRYFMTTTLGHPIVMGRKTFESMGKPLPRRENIVISRNPKFHPEGTVKVSSVEEALSYVRRKFGHTEEEVFIIGGAEIYRQALPFADRIYLTEIDRVVEGDAFFPEWDAKAFRVSSERPSEKHPDVVYRVFERVNSSSTP